MLRAEGIIKTYGDLKVLKGVELEVKAQEIVSIVGASGAGKSTLLHILGTLDKPTEGEIWLNDQNISTLKANALADFRNKHIGFIFQFHNLLPEFTALENVSIPAWLNPDVSKEEIEERAVKLLKMLGLEHRINHNSAQLSGGEQQRVSVARSLINQPSIIFADEPSGNLDSKNANDLHELFFQLREEMNQTFVIVTHNEELANMTDRKLVMEDGKIITSES
ncbi:MAG: ABC transporter ATP-binding protein [Cytophagales bacterium]|nr:ABC transporter ATP-binding protein [Cytophagales bacterium]